MYAVLLNYNRDPQLRLLSYAHRYVMTTIQKSIDQLGIRTEFQGTSDLTFNNRKVSGNSLRCKRDWLLYHGTVICKNMNLSLIAECLGRPAREPNYRRGRSHQDFVGCLPATSLQIATSLQDTWQCEGVLETWPSRLTENLVQEKYSKDSWNYRI